MVESGVLAANSSKIYAAFFEFMQGSSPQVIWRSVSPEKAVEDALLWFVMSTPRIPSANEDVSRPLITRSFMGCVHYIGFYISVADIESRGFSRWLCFAVASGDSSVIECVEMLYKDRFVEMLGKMFEKSWNLFGAQIRPFVELIDRFLETHRETADQPLLQQLQERKEKLNQFAEKFQNRMVDRSYQPTEAALAQVNNQLRDIGVLIGLSEFIPEIESILKEADVDPYELAYRAISPDQEFAIPKETALGLVRKDSTLLSMLFALNCGITLVIVSEESDLQNAMSLMESLSSLLIYRWSDDCVVCHEPKEPEELLGHSIVVIPSLLGNNRYVSVFNFTTQEYKGVQCPPHSFLHKILDPMGGTERDISFQLFLHYSLLDMRDKFVRFTALYLTRYPRPFHELPHLMEMNKMSKEDEPIYRFWMAVMTNKNHQKPIMLENLCLE